jgi:iron complex outermembrane receptor protein
MWRPLLLLSFLPLLPLSAQTGSLAGTVADATTRTPVNGARVEVSTGGRVVARPATAANGSFRVERLAPGTYYLVAFRIGYAAGVAATVAVRAGETSTVTLELVPRAVTMDAEVVTASRGVEKVLDAPASVSVIGREELSAQPSLTPADYLAELPGVDVVTSGLTQHNVVTRGFNNAGSGQLLVLSDNRNAAIPSLRVNAYNFIPLTDEDIERIEVVRGPGAALYGPNTTAGVLHLLTRSPFDSRGTTVTVAGGERSLFQVAARHAATIGSRVGWKLSGQYFRADDFGFTDPEEQANRDAALSQGASPDTLRVGRRDSTIERVSGEARVDVRAGDLTTLIGSVGFNQAINNVDITGFGAAQVHGWRYQYAQVRLVRSDLFAQVFYNGSDAGDTYQLRTGLPVIDRSRMLVGQFQHLVRPLTNETLTWGLDVQRTDPRTGGSIYGRYESDDLTNEAGAYLHSETRLRAVDLVAALRLDHHSRVPGIVLSPRGALVLHPGPEHTVRLTYNRAFSTPTSNDLFLDLLVDSLRDPATNIAIPYAVRVLGVPQSGFTYRRNCAGGLGELCMRSPFAPASLGGPTQYLAADATLLWDVLVDSLRNRGVDLTGIPAPTSTQVGSVLGRLDAGNRRFNPIQPDDVTDLDPLGHKTTSTLEAGYKGLLTDRLLAAVDLYYSWYQGFTSEYIATPNVLFDGPSLGTYLAGFLPAAQAGQIATVVATIPVGTVSPEQAFDPTDIVATYRNYGRVSLWGVDAAATFRLSDPMTLGGTYSWVSDNLFTNLSGSGDTLALNAPRHKASLTATYADEARRLTVRAVGRYVGAFPVKSGLFAGRVQPYAVLDAELGLRVPFAPRTRLSLAAWNLIQAGEDAFGSGWRLRSRHREFVRVPEMGRVVVAKLRVQI